MAERPDQVSPSTALTGTFDAVGAAEREALGPEELAVVLSHYDLGVLRSIRPYLHGSRRSPKVFIRSDRGTMLLKRRAPGRDEPPRVAFAHAMQARLAEHGYPVARLHATRDERSTLLQHEGHAYELFDFVEAQRYAGTAAQTAEAGRALASLHNLLSGFDCSAAPEAGSFHARRDLPATLSRIADSVGRAEPDADRAAVSDACEELAAAYTAAAEHLAALGYADLPPLPLHGDWHPGNLLYRGDAVVAVVDFDSVRCEPRTIDVANGALQFSLQRTGEADPLAWPANLDVERYLALLRGYDERARPRLSEAERRAVPWLMLEALVLETAAPIAATGRFAHLPGSRFLEHARQTVRWIAQRAARPMTDAQRRRVDSTGAAEAEPEAERPATGGEARNAHGRQ